MKYIFILLIATSLICSLDSFIYYYLKKETVFQKAILFILINSYNIIKKIKLFFQQ